MSNGLDEFGQPNRTFPAHYGVALVAAIGAIAVQFAWPVILRREPAASWWPVDACVLVAATGYLLGTAWFHARSARWRPNALVPRLWQLGSFLCTDLLIGVISLILFVQGTEANMLRSGLWIVLPTLLAAVLVAMPVSALALRDGWRRFLSDIPPTDAPSTKPRKGWLLAIVGAMLFLSLCAIESVEPLIKPWDQPTTAADK